MVLRGIVLPGKISVYVVGTNMGITLQGSECLFERTVAYPGGDHDFMLIWRRSDSKAPFFGIIAGGQLELYRLACLPGALIGRREAKRIHAVRNRCLPAAGILAPLSLSITDTGLRLGLDERREDDKPFVELTCARYNLSGAGHEVQPWPARVYGR